MGVIYALLIISFLSWPAVDSSDVCEWEGIEEYCCEWWSGWCLELNISSFPSSSVISSSVHLCWVSSLAIFANSPAIENRWPLSTKTPLSRRLSRKSEIIIRSATLNASFVHFSKLWTYAYNNLLSQWFRRFYCWINLAIYPLTFNRDVDSELLISMLCQGLWWSHS